MTNPVQIANSGGAASGSGNVQTVVFGSTITSGNSVKGAWTWNHAGVSDINTITDDKGNSYSTDRNTYNLAQNSGLCFFYLLNITNGPKTITLNVDGNFCTQVAGVAQEHSGDGSAGIDQSSIIINTSDTNINGTQITTTQNGENCYGVMTDCFDANNTASTAASPWTLENNTSGCFIFDEYYSQPTAGNITAGFTVASSTITIVYTVGFKPGSGSSAVTPSGSFINPLW